MPVPSHIGAWVVGGLVREGVRRYGRKVAIGAAASTAMMAPFAGRRSKRPRSSEIQDESGYVQLTNLGRNTVGRKASQSKKLRKMVEAQMLTSIDRFQYLSPANATNGRYWLSHAPDASAPTKYFFPFYTFDLTSLRSNVFNSTKYCGALPLSRLARGTNDEYTWEPQAGIGPDGISTSNFWQSERVPYNSSSSNLPYEKVYLEWADIRLNFWGATTLPSSAEVLLVRFPDDNRCPDGIECLDTVGAPASLTYTFKHPTLGAADSPNMSDYMEYTKFWTSQMDNLVNTTQNVRHQGVDQRGMVVLYRKKIDFNPTATFENDTTGHQYTLKMFVNLDMLCDFKHAVTQGTVSDGIPVANQANVNFWKSDIGANECRSLLKNKESRLFLVIRGLTSVTSPYSPTGDGTAAQTASFDVLVRRKHSTI